MRRIETVVLAVSTACLMACGVSVEQAPVLSISTTEDTSDLASRYEALEVAEPHVTSIRLLAADPAQARAMLRSQKLPARHRKLWEDEEIVLELPRHVTIMAGHRPSFAADGEERIIGL
ncbi:MULTISPECIES: hypothetical protein [unclassified Janthinobacterium]|uniref:hypothetical protein n=1 Tax=unclassified Janthinobacterium TaxID=2610881 RepID=UPI001616DB6E|nr:MULTISPECIES: hypothetical protein [unclassified Janthinobacterium]MBB5608830.1 hypothetical protein [Janthinobacterium sp. S3T4]MBB5615902.1 hypothetical protein [Janthinobacterium sp. S3M3]